MKYITTIVLACCALSAYPQGSKPAEPISIVFGDMKSEKPELLAYAEALNKRSDTGTQDYTAMYATMIKKLKLVGVHNLTQQEMDLVASVAQPDEQAALLYLRRKEYVEQAQTSKTIEITQWAERTKLQKEIEKQMAFERKEKEEAKQRELERNRIEAKKAAAMERQARAFQNAFNRY